MTRIKENIRDVEEKIQAACDRVGRKREEVTLIAVSKTMPVEYLREAYLHGLRVFGENKVQELVRKYEELKSDGIEWHMIGHLQVNKVKYLPEIASLIHSVDSLKLAEEIQRIGEKYSKIMDILVQINLSLEDSKFGITKDEAEDFIKRLSAYPNLKVRGLMTVPPFVEEPEDNRQYFRELRKIMVDLNAKNIDNIDMNILSIGMTGDYEVAIEEGATHIRVGTGIFGERSYLP